MDKFDEHWKKQDLIDDIARHFQEHCYAQKRFARKLGISLHKTRNIILRKTRFFELHELETLVQKINEDR